MALAPACLDDEIGAAVEPNYVAPWSGYSDLADHLDVRPSVFDDQFDEHYQHVGCAVCPFDDVLTAENLDDLNGALVDWIDEHRHNGEVWTP